MFDLLKTFLGDNNPRIMRKEFYSLTTRFERDVENSVQDNVVNLATRLREILHDVQLTRTDKIRLLKMINKAKVRALVLRTEDGNRTFQDLDLIGSDILKLM